MLILIAKKPNAKDRGNVPGTNREGAGLDALIERLTERSDLLLRMRTTFINAQNNLGIGTE